MGVGGEKGRGSGAKVSIFFFQKRNANLKKKLARELGVYVIFFLQRNQI